MHGSDIKQAGPTFFAFSFIAFLIALFSLLFAFLALITLVLFLLLLDDSLLGRRL